jgi:hypothetical protein
MERPHPTTLAFLIPLLFFVSPTRLTTAWGAQMYVCRDTANGQVFTDSPAQLDRCELLAPAPPSPTGAMSSAFPPPVQSYLPPPIVAPPSEISAPPLPPPPPHDGLSTGFIPPAAQVVPPAVAVGIPPAETPPPCPIGINPLNRFSAPPCPRREQSSPISGSPIPADQPSSVTPQ